MSVARRPVTFTSAVVAAAGTSVAPGTAVPDNCHTILILNTSTTLTGLVGIATAPAALTAGTNATQLPPLGSITMAVLTSDERGPMDETTLTGSGLAFDAIGGAITFNVTYLSRVGGRQ